MKTFSINDELLLQEGAAPEPQPATGEVAIEVHAAGVIIGEWQWYSTSYTKDGARRERAVPGHEFSGTVSAVGAGVIGFQPGDEVFGMNDWFRDGAMAEYCVTEPAAIAPKPKSLTHLEAATVPIGALTAWQGLFEHAHLQAGERLLVHGGVGSVGSFVLQLARWKGARIVATASARNASLAESLGAREVLDYRKTPFEQAGKFDVVFDTVGGSTLERSWPLLKAGGRMVTVANSSSDSSEKRVKQAFFIVKPDAVQLGRIGELLDSGTLRTIVDAAFPLDQCPDVYSERVVRKRQGKLVIVIKDC